VRAVNLMPRDERRGARLQLGRLPLLGAAGGVILVTAAAFLLASSASSTTDDLKAELQAVEAAIARVPDAPGAAVNSGAMVQERSDRVAALSAALTTRRAFDRVLREIALVLPANVWLTSLDATSGASTAALGAAAPPPQAVPTAGGVTIEGATYSHDAVATVLARLSLVPSLSGVRLTATALVDPGASDPQAGRKSQKQFVTFVVSASVRAEGES
jgi:Tfp pilus assembly protein PilN